MKKNIITSLIFSLTLTFSLPFSALAAGPPAINLGSIQTNNFVILAETGVTNAAHGSSITGNVGNSPGAAAQMDDVFCSEITGTIYGVDATYTGSGATTCFAGNPPLSNKTLVDNAVLDMGTAYTNASAPATPAGVGPNLNIGAGTVGVMTLAPGTYTWGSNVSITGDVTLSGAANDVWIFQVNGTLDLNVGMKILLSGGAQAKNVFWQVTGAVTLLSGSEMKGIILAQTNIAMQAGAVLNGRALAQTAVTLIGNTISAPTTAPTSSVGRRTSTPIVPLIGVLKVPSPLALPDGAGNVTYKYTVWNVGGKQPLVDVTLVDDKCSPVVLSSGDIEKNKKLDIDESWTYTCTTMLTSNTTNTAIATGYSDDGYHTAAIATAIATVAVGTPIPPPIIHIVKVPNQLTPFPFGGGDVVYTYTVKNPGVVAMNNVKVTDDKCPAVSFVSGDNGNNLLEVSESWVYTCKTKVKVSTGSVATAKGDANGFTALAYAFTNVLVSAPDLPDTGFTPEGISWTTAILSGIIILLGTSLVIVSRKRKV